MDFTTEFGRRVSHQLDTELVIWLTTVGADLTPQPRPVWFLWEGESVLIYSETDTHKVRHIARRPKVSLNFSTDRQGHHVAVMTGVASIDSNAPPANEHAEYIAKYRDEIAALGMTEGEFGTDYSVAVRVESARLRGS